MNKIVFYINKLIADQKRKFIERKYYDLFMLVDLDYYQYLELQKMKKKEIDKLKL